MNQVIKYLLNLIVLLLVNISSIAQNFEPIFKNISNELPSYQVYNIFQDSIGYLWFTTDNGIARYDGKNILTINTSPYFTTRVTFNFYEISPHKVWVNTDENELYWFDPLSHDFKFHPYLYNDTLSSKIKSLHNKEHLRSICFIKDNALKATFLKGSGYIEINNKGNSYINGKIKHNLETHKFSELNLKQEGEFFYTYFNYKKPGTFWFEKDNKKQIITKSYNYTNNWLYGISDITFHKNVVYILSSKYLIKKIEDNIQSLTLPNEGFKIFIYDNLIYIATYNGVYIIDEYFKITDHFLKNKIVTSLLKDKENGFWFSTLENGVFYTKNIDLKKLSNINYIPKNIIIKNNHLVVINNKSVMDIFDLNGQLLYKYKNVYIVGQYIISKQKLPKSIFSDTYFYREKDQMYGYIKNQTERHFYSHSHDQIKWNKSNNSKLIKINNIEKIDSYINLSDTFALILSENRIIKYNIYTHQKITLDFGIVDEEIISIEKHNHSLFIVTKHQLYIYKIAEHFEFKYLIKINNIDSFTFYFESETIVWAFNKTKIYKYFIENKYFKKIDYTNNFPFTDLSSILIYKSKLWFGSKEGVSYININDLKSDGFKLNKNNFILDSIQIDNQNYIISDTINIYSNNTINLYFKYLSYQENNPLKFEFKLDNNRWLLANENNLFIQSLSLGYHQLKIRAEKKILFSQVIYVKPMFKQTIWFYLLIIILISIILFLLFKLWLSYKLKKQKEELVKLNLELKLLTSLMNPHFMFNTINSIQLYILEKSKNQAIQYLSDFAKLIRQSLDFSFNEFILLKDELQFLKRYIELENKRFNDTFILELEISKSIDINFEKIPSFIIQPIIENVIQHANYGNETIKKISLTIEKKDDVLTIKVTDFGIQKHIKTRNINKHKSYGLDIIKNRLKIFNGKQFSEKDLLIKKNKEIGYIVTLKIYLNEYNYS